ncbi:hypothetical protein ACI2TD_22985 [Ralstonia nicotianae]
MSNYINMVAAPNGGQLINDLNSALDPGNEHQALAVLQVLNDIASLVPAWSAITNLVTGVTSAIDASYASTSPEGRVGDALNIVSSLATALQQIGLDVSSGITVEATVPYGEGVLAVTDIAPLAAVAMAAAAGYALGSGLNATFRTVTGQSLSEMIVDVIIGATTKRVDSTVNQCFRSVLFNSGADPLAIDLTGGGISTIGASQSGVMFDTTGSGNTVSSGWINQGTGWLVYDPAGTKTLTSETQLFGAASHFTKWEVCNGRVSSAFPVGW